MPNSTTVNLTFYLPIMALVVIEITRISRDIDLHAVVKEGHRPLIVSSIFSLPAKSVGAVYRMFFQLLKFQVDSAHNLLNSPANAGAKIVEFQISFLEYFVNEEPPEEFEQWLEGANNSVFEYYQARLDHAHSVIINRITNFEDEIFNEVANFETFLVPKTGRFAFLHALNYSILSYLFFLTWETLGGQVRIISITFIALLWLTLPVLEVEEYDLLLSNNKKVDSLTNHVAYTLVTIGVLYYTIPLGLSNPLTNTHQILYGIVTVQLTYAVFPILCITFTIWYFLHTLEKELHSVITTKPSRAS